VWEGPPSLKCTFDDDTFSRPYIWCRLCVSCAVLWLAVHSAAVGSDHSLPICSPKHGLSLSKNVSQWGLIFLSWNVMYHIGSQVLQILRDLTAFIVKVLAQDCMHLDDEGSTVPWNDGTNSLPFVFQEFWEQPISAMFVHIDTIIPKLKFS
jgi:hypothetical protein